MSETTARLPRSGAACPHCGAARVPDVSWCTQCFAVLDAPAPAPAEPQEPAAALAQGFELSAWDLAQREAAAAHDGEPELDLTMDLAADGHDRSGFAGWVVALSGSLLGKVAIVAVTTVVLFAVLFGAMALIGTLL